MTFFLNEQPGPVEIKARGTDTPLPSLWGGISAAFQKEQLESNANFRTERETIFEEDKMAVEAARFMGADKIRPMVDAFNERARAAGMKERPMPEDLADIPSIFGPNFSRNLLEQVRQDPEWAGPDVSAEAAEQRVNERLKKEHQDLEATMGAMGGGLVAATIAGGIAGSIADVRNAPFLAVGGGSGSIARVMGREAMLNVAAEAVTLPDRFDMAKRLDIPEPDIAMTLAFAAGAGAAFGGAVEGLARGVTYWRGTRTGDRATRVSRHDQEMNVDVAEDAINDLNQPFARVREDTVPAPRDIEEAEIGPFGRVNRDIDNDPEAAIGRLLQDQDGEVPRAYSHPDPRIGDVALVYGNDKYGLRHIEAKHPEMIPEIPRLLREGRVVEDQSGLPRAFLVDEADPAGVLAMRLDWDGQDKTWVVTSFRDEWSKFARDQQEAYRPDLTDARVPASSERLTQHLRTSNEPDASVSSRIPDTTGQFQDSAAAPEIQSSRAATEPDDIQRAMAEAHSGGEAMPARIDPEVLEARQSAVASGRELDEALFQMPPSQAWVDDAAQRQAILQQKTAGLRDDLARAEREGATGPMVDLGNGERSIASILDELDADDEFAAIVDLCGRGKA